MLAIVGQAPTSLDGQGSFQDTSGRNGSLDAAALFSTVSLHCERVTDPARITEAVATAIDAARAGGPAVLLLPKDVQQSTVASRTSLPHSNPHPTPHSSMATRPVAPATAEDISRAIGTISGDVTIIGGEQVARDDARLELEQLRAALGARMAVVPDAKDVSASPALLGVTGVMGHPNVLDVIRDSALCLIVGTRLQLTAGVATALANVRTISIGSAPPYVESTHFASDELRTTLSSLARTAAGSRKTHVGGRAHTEETHTELVPPPHDGPGVRYVDAMRALNDALPHDADIVVDAGNTGAAGIHYLPARPDGRFVVALGMGGMGYSFGAGIGVAFGRGRRTVVIAGDGAFFMHGMEVHTAVQYRLPITFVLFNNNAHAMCVTREQLFYEDDYTYNRFQPSRLGAGLAAMFPQLRSVDVTDVSQLAEALDGALATDGPSVISVECSADEIPPFAPFLMKSPPIPPTKENRTDVAASA